MSKGRVHDDSQDRAKAGSLNGHNRKQILSCVHSGSLVAGLAFVDFVPSKSIVTAPRLDHVGEVEKSWPGE
jgi:hypothetical protein